MGSLFEHISIEKATEALGVTRRQVNRYIKNGRLRTFKDGLKHLVYREDVARIIQEKEAPKAAVPLSLSTVKQHDYRIHMLEQRVSFLMRLHDLHNDPLGLDAKTLLRFYQVAVTALDGAWAPHQEKTWADFFVRLQVDDLEKLCTVLADGVNPWLPFHAVCRVLISEPYDSEFQLQFKAGKAHLEQIAYVWSTTQGKTSKDIAKEVKKSNTKVKSGVRKARKKRSKN